MDKKYFIVVLLIIAVVLVSGCTSKPKTDTTTTQAVGGAKGLDMSFMPGQPPAEVYDSVDKSNFQIAVKVENVGEFAVDSAKVFLTGIDKNSFNLIPKGVSSISDSQTLTTITPTKRVGNSIIPGGVKIATWTAFRKYVPVTSAFTVQALVLYPYQSEAIATICLKENIYQQTSGGSELCKLTGTKTVQNLGAPVKVASVEEMPTGFKIKVSNVGGGAPFVRASGNAYVADKDADIDKYNELNKVRISASIPNVKVECPSDELILVNGQAETFCQADLQASQEYTDLLTIKLNYGYRQTASTTFNVLHVPGASQSTTTSTTKGKCPDSTSQAVLDAAGGCAAITEAQYPNIWSQCSCGA